MFNFCRGYYRCTHQKLYNCAAKKQVQRMDNDPSIFEVMYRGTHTCHMSATAPTSILPPQGGFVAMSQSMVMDHHQLQPLITTATTCSVPLGGSWLSMKCSAAAAGGGNGGGGNTKDMVHDFHPVLDMADVMFNSGSSSSNSMEFLFPTSMEEDHK